MDKKAVIISVLAVLFLGGCSFSEPGKKGEPVPVAKSSENSTSLNKEPSLTNGDGSKGETDRIVAKRPPSIALDAPVSFDACGKPEQYKNEAWFNAFSDLVKNFYRVDIKDAEAIDKNTDSTNSPQEYQERQGKISMDDVKELCYSKAGHLVIAIQGGHYCQRGNLFRFDTQNQLIEKATVLTDDWGGCQASLYGFGKRLDNIIPVKAAIGDAGYYAKVDYNFDFVANTVRPIRVCEGSVDGGKKGDECRDL